MSNKPLAYFLTWTCYGTRIHGDPRGSVEKYNNVYGTPKTPASPVLRRIAQAGMTPEGRIGVKLADTEREIVHTAIVDHAAHRDWRILALNADGHTSTLLWCATFGPSSRSGSSRRGRADAYVRRVCGLRPTRSGRPRGAPAISTSSRRSTERFTTSFTSSDGLPRAARTPHSVNLRERRYSDCSRNRLLSSRDQMFLAHRHIDVSTSPPPKSTPWSPPRVQR